MQGIIFDFNGTMFFDEDFQVKAWKQFIGEKTGRDISDQEFQDHIHGRPSEVILNYFLSRPVSRAETERLEEEKEQIYRNLCLNSDVFHLAEGLPQFLDKMTERGVPMAIATASGRNNVEFFFEHFQLEKWFDIDRVVYNDGTFPGKPEPDIYLRAAEKLNLDIGDCVVFEDAKSGITAAVRAHAHKVIGVESMEARDTLLQWGADDTIRDFRDL
ncbi:MAG: HAD family phosphatase [Clostridiales bacterium]|nr:HAD family phosphatase [Clostridiales bacterium]